MYYPGPGPGDKMLPGKYVVDLYSTLLINLCMAP